MSKKEIIILAKCIDDLITGGDTYSDEYAEALKVMKKYNLIDEDGFWIYGESDDD